MRSVAKGTALLAAALLVFAAGTAAASKRQAYPKPAQEKAAPTKPAPAKPVPTHATSGVVKSVDASTLVITRKDKKATEMTFTLNSATKTAGTVAVGESVSVRYREEGGSNIATAVRVMKAKKPAAPAKK